MPGNNANMLPTFQIKSLIEKIKHLREIKRKQFPHFMLFLNLSRISLHSRWGKGWFIILQHLWVCFRTFSVEDSFFSDFTLLAFVQKDILEVI